MTAGNFNVSMLLTANAQQAKGELNSVSAAVGKTKAEVQGLGQASASADAQIAALQAELGRMRTQLEAVVVAEAKASSAAQALTAKVAQLEAALGSGRGRGGGGGGAAGATSNLVAQFNDVGQMLVAGQSPLLLAAQQGTQISQALGPLGARGAVQALGAAFLGMLNPVNLAVFGAVASLGLLGGALRDIGGETKSVEDAFGDLEDATKSWQEQARVGTSDLARMFGTVTPEILDLQEQLTRLALAETLLKAVDAAEALGKSLNPGTFGLSSRSANIADLLGVDELTTGVFQKLTPQVEEFQRLLGSLGTSENVGDSIASLDRMQAIILQSAGGFEKMSGAQREFYLQTAELEQKLRLVQAAQKGIGSAAQIAQAWGEKTLADLRQEADIRQLVARFGEDSVEVTRARSEAERQAFAALLASKDITGQLRDDLLAAWDAANGVDLGVKGMLASFLDVVGASDDTRRAVEDAWDAVTGAAGATNVWAGAMAGVAAEVRGIGSALSRLGAAGIANASKEVERDALKAGKSAADARIAVTEYEIREDGKRREAQAANEFARLNERAATEEKLRGVALDKEIADLRDAANERERLANGAASRGAAAARKQTAEAQKLIAGLEDELELLRVTDPVQKEMIRNREALSGATEAERQKVEELIRAKQREERTQKQVQETWEFSKNTAYDTLETLIFQGGKASEVMANLAEAIGKALLQSALLGSGPLAGLFGGQGTGLLGGLFGGGVAIDNNIVGVATGGMITGPGGPTDDLILARLSDGEFVVNAAATARHRPLLEQINRAPGFARGGAVGGGAFGSPLGQGGRAPIEIHLMLTDDLDARVGRTSEEVSVRVMKGGLEHYTAKVLPGRVAQIRNDPRKVG